MWLNVTHDNEQAIDWYLRVLRSEPEYDGADRDWLLTKVLPRRGAMSFAYRDREQSQALTIRVESPVLAKISVGVVLGHGLRNPEMFSRVMITKIREVLDPIPIRFFYADQLERYQGRSMNLFVPTVADCCHEWDKDLTHVDSKGNRKRRLVFDRRPENVKDDDKFVGKGRG